MKLPDTIQTIPMSQDPNRDSESRSVGLEVYGPFGRRVGLWSKKSLGTFPDRDDAPEIYASLNASPRRWLRFVTYRTP